MGITYTSTAPAGIRGFLGCFCLNPEVPSPAGASVAFVVPLVDSIEPEIDCDIKFLNGSVFNTYMTDIAYVSCSETASLFIP